MGRSVSGKVSGLFCKKWAGADRSLHNVVFDFFFLKTHLKKERTYEFGSICPPVDDRSWLGMELDAGDIETHDS